MKEINAMAAQASCSKDLVALRKTSLDISLVVSDSKHCETFVCGICSKLVSLDCVVTSRCNHLFCRQCLEEAIVVHQTLSPLDVEQIDKIDLNNLYSHYTSCMCPTCQTTIRQDNSLGWNGNMSLACTIVGARPIQELQPLAYNVLKLVQVRCSIEGCTWIGDYGKYLRHMASHIINVQTTKQAQLGQQLQDILVQQIKSDICKQEHDKMTNTLERCICEQNVDGEASLTHQQNWHDSDENEQQDRSRHSVPLHKQIQSYLISPPKRTQKRNCLDDNISLSNIPREIIFEIGGGERNLNEKMNCTVSRSENCDNNLRSIIMTSPRIEDNLNRDEWQISNPNANNEPNENQSKSILCNEIKFEQLILPLRRGNEDDTYESHAQMEENVPGEINYYIGEIDESDDGQVFFESADHIEMCLSNDNSNLSTIADDKGFINSSASTDVEKLLPHQVTPDTLLNGKAGEEHNSEPFFDGEREGVQNDAIHSLNTDDYKSKIIDQNQVERVEADCNSEPTTNFEVEINNDDEGSSKEQIEEKTSHLQYDNDPDIKVQTAEYIEYDLDSPEPSRNRHKEKKDLDTSINSTGCWSESASITEVEQSQSHMEEDDDGLGLSDEQRYERTIARADKLKKQANAKFNKGKFDEARALYTESINLMSSFCKKDATELKLLSNMHSNRAVTYFRERDYYKCIEDCDSALLYEPTYDKSWIRKWRALMGLGKFHEAFNCIEEGSSKLPFSKKIIAEFKKVKADKQLLMEVGTLFEKNEFHAARKLLQKHVIVTENTSLLCFAARVDIHLGYTDDALDKLKKALHMNPIQPDAIELRGIAYFTDGDIDYGIKVLHDAIYSRDIKEMGGMKETLAQFQKTQTASLQGRDAVQIRMFDVAIEHYTEAINGYQKLPPLSQLFGILHKERAEAYVLSRQFVLALEDCQEVMRYQTDYAPVIILNAEILLFLGRPHEAKDELAVARKAWGANDPEVEDAFYRADFETRIVRVDNDIHTMMQQLEKGSFVLKVDNGTSSREKRGVKVLTNESSDVFNAHRRSTSHIESRSFGADNVSVQKINVEDSKKSKEVRRKKSWFGSSKGQSERSLKKSLSSDEITPNKSPERRRNVEGAKNRRDETDKKKSSRSGSGDEYSRSARRNQIKPTEGEKDVPRNSSRTKSRDKSLTATKISQSKV